jgi:hypothetical protein
MEWLIQLLRRSMVLKIGLAMAAWIATTVVAMYLFGFYHPM